MIKKTLVFVFLFLLVLAISLVVHVPVAFVWEKAQPHLNLQKVPVNVQAIKGTVWKGEALLRIDAIPGVLNWQLKPLNMLSGEKALELQFRSTQLNIAASASAESESALDVSASANASLAVLDTVLRKHRIKIGGVAEISRLQLSLDPKNGWPTSGQGMIVWEGGNVSYPVGRRTQQAEMPPLTGEMAMQGEDIVLDVMTQQARLPVMKIQLAKSGVATVEVRRRLIDLAQAPWSGGGTPDTVVFKVQQRLK